MELIELNSRPTSVTYTVNNLKGECPISPENDCYNITIKVWPNAQYGLEIESLKSSLQELLTEPIFAEDIPRAIMESIAPLKIFERVDILVKQLRSDQTTITVRDSVTFLGCFF